jgi:hypothetical protein
VLSCGFADFAKFSIPDRYLYLKKDLRRKRMKTFQQFCAAAVLTLALTFSSSAGDISVPGATNPPPRKQSTATIGTDFEGGTSTTEVLTSELPIFDPATELAVSLLESIIFFI